MLCYTLLLVLCQFMVLCVLIVLGSAKEVEWPPFGEELLSRLSVFALCIMYICNLSYFPFWYRGHNFVSDFSSS